MKNCSLIENNKRRKRYYVESIIAGLVGAILLLIFYWATLYFVSKDISHPFEQFNQYKYWIIALVIGFGIQAALFWYIRSELRLANTASKSAIAAGAGTSTFSMAACCAHHILDFLPIVGFSGIALFLTEYQVYFFLLGIISNVIGILLMVRIIKNVRMSKIGFN